MHLILTLLQQQVSQDDLDRNQFLSRRELCEILLNHILLNRSLGRTLQTMRLSISSNLRWLLITKRQVLIHGRILSMNAVKDDFLLLPKRRCRRKDPRLLFSRISSMMEELRFPTCDDHLIARRRLWHRLLSYLLLNLHQHFGPCLLVVDHRQSAAGGTAAISPLDSHLHPQLAQCHLPATTDPRRKSEWPAASSGGCQTRYQSAARPSATPCRPPSARSPNPQVQTSCPLPPRNHQRYLSRQSTPASGMSTSSSRTACSGNVGR